MSGPKLSEAEIERLRQEQLEKERREALRRLMEARGVYTDSQAKIKLLIYSARSRLNSLDAIYRSEIESQLASVISSFDIKIISSNNPDDYMNAARTMENNIVGYTESINKVLIAGMNRCRNDISVAKSNATMRNFAISLDEIGSEVKAIHIDFTCDYSREQLKEYIKRAILHYTYRLRSNPNPRMKAFDEKAVLILNEMLKDQNLDEVSTKKKMQQLFNDEEEVIRLNKRWDERYDEYIALAMILSKQPIESSSFSSVEEIENQIKEMQEEYQKKDEMDFIADQINEVMLEMGYSFVTSKVLTKKDQGETEFSLYKESEASGIAVYTDQTGAVMMRMTVLGNSTDISEADREFSYQSQIDFCSRHSDLVEALAQRGVYLKQKSYKAPGKEHTFKVNTNSQNASVVNNNAEKQTQKIDRRARRRAGSKKMRSL